jgi:phospholipase C
LPPISARSRDNLPNPIHTERDPYVPVNRPAIGDLTGLFDFKRKPRL